MIDYNKTPLTIGDFARNIESGWKGKILEYVDGFVKMIGVNYWAVSFGEQDIFDYDDIQWFDPTDLIKCK